MDTHIAPPSELEDRGIPASARLPGEPDPDAQSAPAAGPSERLAPSSEKAPTKRNRVLLLGGVAGVAVVVLAGGAFVLSPFNQVVPIPADVAAAARQVAKDAGIDVDRPLAPSASLAGIDPPSRPLAVVLPHYVPEPHDHDLSELLSIRPGSATADAPNASQPAPAKPGKPPTAAQTFVPHEPGSTIPSEAATSSAPPPLTRESTVSPTQPHPAARDITQAVVVAAAPDPAPPQPKPVTERAAQTAERQGEHKPDAVPGGEQKPPQSAAVPPDAPPDAVLQALHLEAGPMSDEHQVQVLELVTKMAKVVTDLESQAAALRADFAKTTADTQAHLADFARRIDLAEAIKAVAVAQHAGDLSAISAPVGADPLSVRPATTLAPIAVTRPDVALPASAPQDAKRYRVQAASPGLALLTEIARGGGDGAQVQVTVGDTIPGWGKVKSVSQRGTSWVVSTEKGVID
jgi:hypothetical protein